MYSSSRSVLKMVLLYLSKQGKQILKNIAYRLPDRLYIRLGYFMTFKRFPSLNHPQTYTEKIQRCKLHQTEQIYTDLADKYTVRTYVTKKIQEDILVELYWHGSHPDSIPFDTLPNSFVIKCNHGSKYNIFVHDKTKINLQETKKQLEARLSTDFWRIGREQQYKHIKKQIIVEQLLIDEETRIPVDYKIYCFNGKPVYICVMSGRFVNQSNDYFDMDWNLQPFSCTYPQGYRVIKKPLHFETMITYAKILAEGFSFMRVDFYQVNDKVYFGEITFTPDSGYGIFLPNHRKVDLMIGKMITLPKSI